MAAKTNVNPALIKYSSEKKWYVLYVKSRTEKKVLERMEKFQYEVFLPLIKTMRQWSDRRKQVLVPLFNGYMFAHISPDDFTGIRMIEGVVNFVSVEGKYATIRNEQIETIRTFIETGYHMESVAGDFAPGEKVKITFGPLKDCEGELLDVQNEKHFIVRIDAINQILKVSVPANYLQKVKVVNGE
ncbi:MAG: UpxY family transcription antiterminator [Bacteroidetes bacterium]|nr:UpxY family transcription antiterminator [Bacteroidota bacterium]MBP7398961.1 UpxY family transcription antiterminator [Chitinophagales bacterium]MBK7107798.1 UpxY family transcription antiterminator [Bacteroidota bacterium]MBK8486771.1 UpxY family transcription antiterminator [Bacteroidota bacterium]MBK8681334.1 UpxY family transcription antiterminator [Bacteroidota bacterium]